MSEARASFLVDDGLDDQELFPRSLEQINLKYICFQRPPISKSSKRAGTSGESIFVKPQGMELLVELIAKELRRQYIET